MAVINDGKFKIEVKPRFIGNGWVFDFSFWYDNKPLFNPEITKSPVFTADEYKKGEFVDMLEKSLNPDPLEYTCSWYSWDGDLGVEISNYVARGAKGFGFRVFIDHGYFKGSEVSHMFQPAGLKLIISAEDFRKFIEDLKTEIENKDE